MKPYPYILEFTKYFKDLDHSINETLGFTTIKSAREWVKRVNQNMKLEYCVTGYIVRRA